MSLKVNLSVIELDDKANKTEAMKLPDWLKGIIKQKGLPWERMSRFRRTSPSISRQ